jgi:ABC-type transport system involved in cytochrome bd biosynthesis fused ATPase/permease subunit
VLPDQLSTLTQTGISGAFSLVFWLTFKALLAWLITVPMLSLAMYLILLGTVNRRHADIQLL